VITPLLTGGVRYSKCAVFQRRTMRPRGLTVGQSPQRLMWRVYEISAHVK
jgi:hypothetical protein